MRKVFVIIFLLIFAFIYAIESNPGSEADVTENSRDTEVFYHTNSEDLNWYGSDKWCVKFDFTEYFSSIDSIQFNVTGLKIFIPQVTDNIDISLWENTLDDIADSVATVTINLEDQVVGWNAIEWSTPLLEDTIWVVVHYPTFSGQEIAASGNDGSHSYFYEDGILKNMLANGYQSEFLFTLIGNFAFDFNTDFGIKDLALEGILQPDSLVYPKFTITNNSNSVQSSINLEYTRLAPEFSGFHKTDNLLLTFDPPLDIGEERENITLETYIDTLITTASMYDFTINLPADDFNENNSSSFQFDTFNIPFSTHLIENFVRLDQYESTQIWNYQSEIIDLSEDKVINYFTNSNDVPLYNLDSVERFHYYNLGGSPATIVDGFNRFIGFDSEDSTILQNIIDQDDKSTYLSLGSFVGELDITNGNVAVSINIYNENTFVFPNHLSSSKLIFCIIEDIPSTLYDIFGSTFHTKIIEFQMDELFYNNSQRFEFGFNSFSTLEPITGIEDYSNCKIYYWIENSEYNSIDFFGEFPFSDLIEVSTDEEYLSVSQIISYPNPSSITKGLTISLSTNRFVSNPTLEIYNIKGQKVANLNNYQENENNFIYKWNGKDIRNIDTASGIYIIKYQPDERNSSTFYKKIIRINN